MFSEWMLRKALGEVFQAQRRRLGLTVGEVAERTTVGFKGRAWLDALDRKEALRLLLYVDICWALELDPGALLVGIVARAECRHLVPGPRVNLSERSAEVRDVVRGAGAAVRGVRVERGWSVDDLCVKVDDELIRATMLESWEVAPLGLPTVAFVRVVEALDECPGVVLGKSILGARSVGLGKRVGGAPGSLGVRRASG